MEILWIYILGDPMDSEGHYDFWRKDFVFRILGPGLK